MIHYVALRKDDLHQALFSSFNRYQDVKKCWRKEGKDWILKDISFVEQWNEQNYKVLLADFDHTMETGGLVLGAFAQRGRGIGKRLFELICVAAKEKNAKKLYISSHSSLETTAFYRTMGCVEAVEYNQALVELEPYDCQLEYVL